MRKNLLWPTEIYSFKSDIIDNDKIKELILQKEDGGADLRAGLAYRGAWQSNRSILEENEFSEIKDFLFECTSSIKNEIYDDDVKFSLVQSWANVNRYNHDNPSHIHDDSHWSCVYYVTETYTAPLYLKDPRIKMESDPLNFEKKVASDNFHFSLRTKYFKTLGVDKASNAVATTNVFKCFKTLGSEKSISSMPGDVVFFPSWLEHRADKNSTDNPRIVIACTFLIEE